MSRWLSGLPGERIPRRFGRWVRRDDLVAYLARYADQFGIAPRFGVSVALADDVGLLYVLG